MGGGLQTVAGKGPTRSWEGVNQVAKVKKLVFSHRQLTNVHNFLVYNVHVLVLS